jgi:hypothetical protein
MKTYLKTIKELHESDRNTTWRDLGVFRTLSGNARLTEIQKRSKWGNIKMLQIILIHKNKAYILTGATLKDEFLDHHKPILKALRSLKITEDLVKEIKNPSDREYIQAGILALKEENEEKEKKLQQLQKYILQHCTNMGAHWQFLMMRSAFDTASLPQ